MVIKSCVVCRKCTERNSSQQINRKPGYGVNLWRPLFKGEGRTIFSHRIPLSNRMLFHKL